MWHETQSFWGLFLRRMSGGSAAAIGVAFQTTLLVVGDAIRVSQRLRAW